MKISIANDFSRAPWGRFPSDGDYCGENFRKALLLPALRSEDKVTVDLDGVAGLGSSFLDEAFGGLVRYDGFTPEALSSKMEILTNEEDFRMYVVLIWQYIKEAGISIPRRRLASA